jgi:hypothetical protein
MCPLDLAVSALWTWIYGLHQRLLYGTAVRLGARPAPMAAGTGVPRCAATVATWPTFPSPGAGGPRGAHCSILWRGRMERVATLGPPPRAGAWVGTGSVTGEGPRTDCLRTASR